jgi:hypothetical protein
VVAVAHNDEKQPLFSLEQRLDLLRQTAGRIENVRIAEFSGLLVEFARAEKAGAVIRGLRAVSDFEFEFQMALMNRSLNPAVETIFLMPKEEYTYLSSRIVKCRLSSPRPWQERSPRDSPKTCWKNDEARMTNDETIPNVRMTKNLPDAFSSSFGFRPSFDIRHWSLVIQ